MTIDDAFLEANDFHDSDLQSARVDLQNTTVSLQIAVPEYNEDGTVRRTVQCHVFFEAVSYFALQNAIEDDATLQVAANYTFPVSGLISGARSREVGNDLSEREFTIFGTYGWTLMLRAARCTVDWTPTEPV